jgi:hypothetical protein
MGMSDEEAPFRADYDEATSQPTEAELRAIAEVRLQDLFDSGAINAVDDVRRYIAQLERELSTARAVERDRWENAGRAFRREWPRRVS